MRPCVFTLALGFAFVTIQQEQEYTSDGLIGIVPHRQFLIRCKKSRFVLYGLPQTFASLYCGAADWSAVCRRPVILHHPACKQTAKEMLGLLAATAVVIVPVGFLISTLSVMLLRALALIARTQSYEAVLSDSTLERIWGQLQSTQAKDKKPAP